MANQIRPLRIALFGSRGVGKSTYLGQLWREGKQPGSVKVSTFSPSTQEYLDTLAESLTEGFPVASVEPVDLELEFEGLTKNPIRVQTLDVPGAWLSLGFGQGDKHHAARAKVLETLNRSDALMIFFEPAQVTPRAIAQHLQAHKERLHALACDFDGHRRDALDAFITGRLSISIPLDQEARKDAWSLAQDPTDPQFTQLHLLLWDCQIYQWLAEATGIDWAPIITAGWADSGEPIRLKSGRAIGIFGAWLHQLSENASEVDRFIATLSRQLVIASRGPIMAAANRVIELIAQAPSRLIVCLVVLKADQLPGFCERPDQYRTWIPRHLERLKVTRGANRISAIFDGVGRHYYSDTVWYPVIEGLNVPDMRSLVLRMGDYTLDYQMFFVSAIGAETVKRGILVFDPWRWCIERADEIRAVERWRRFHRYNILGAGIAAAIFLLVWLVRLMFGDA